MIRCVRVAAESQKPFDHGGFTRFHCLDEVLRRHGTRNLPEVVAQKQQTQSKTSPNKQDTFGHATLSSRPIPLDRATDLLNIRLLPVNINHRQVNYP